MRRRIVTAILLSSFAGIVLTAARMTSARPTKVLRSFYVVPDNHTILDVSPLGEDVRVRLIRMEQAHPVCFSSLVTAVERVIPRTTVASIAGTDVCANTEHGVVAAVEAARRTAVDMETTQVVQAQCDDEKRVFFLPNDDDRNYRAIRRSSPRVAELEKMYRISDRVFGKPYWFRAETAQQEREMETFGATLVPELTSGKYNAAFEGLECFDQPGKKCVPNYLAWRLRGYRLVPPDERGPKVELLTAASFHLTTYAAPVYPGIAQSARVSGDVQLRLTVDPQTGGVTNVEIVGGSTNLEKVEGLDLLSPAAVEASRRWRFAPESLTGQPIVATVRFSLDC
jgi:TonB family protein